MSSLQHGPRTAANGSLHAAEAWNDLLLGTMIFAVTLMPAFGLELRWMLSYPFSKAVTFTAECFVYLQ